MAGIKIFRSIQWRIAAPYVLLILISMTGLGFFIIDFVEDERLDDLRSQLEGEAVLVGESSRMLLDDSLDTAAINALAMRLGQQIDARVTIISDDGTVWGDSEEDPALMDNHALRPEVIDALRTGFGESRRHSVTLGEDMMYVAIRFDIEGQPAGIARVALPTREVDQSTDRLMTTIILAMGIATVIAIGVALYIARATARPIKAITAAAKRISAGDIDQRIYAGTSDETGELASAFNEMAANLKSTVGDLNAQTNKLSAVLDTISDGVLMTDVQGTVIIANPAVGRLFGFPADQAMGQRLTQLISDHEIHDIFKEYLRTGHQQSRQIEQPRTGRLIRVIVSDITYHGSVGVLLMFQDLTEVRRLQTVRQKFIANVSHELRTPLASIKAVTETLAEGIVTNPDVAADFLGRIETEVDRMTQMVNELSELSRIETGKWKLNLAETNANTLIDDCVSRIKPQADRKQIVLHVDVDPAMPPVLAERDRIAQVLLNLLHNAIKFTPEGGTVTVSAVSEDKSVVFRVTDTGIGISPEDLPHVFERFYKADKARSTQGSGLGLAIAKHIVQAHGGEIWVESEPDQGSTFRFTVPTYPSS